MLPHSAPEAGYVAERSWVFSNIECPEHLLGYFFRVRTVLDEQRNVKSALYGKIHGDINIYVGTRAPQAGVGFTYYLNPTQVR